MWECESVHVCTSAAHVLLLECVFRLPFSATECVSQGMVPSSGSVGWPIIVCPYRDTGAGQPLAIWRGSLVCWLASRLDSSAHTTATSLETEDWGFVQYTSGRGFVASWSSRIYWAPGLTHCSIRGKGTPKSVVFKDASKKLSSGLETTRWTIQSCNQTFKRLLLQTPVNCEFEFFFCVFFGKMSRIWTFLRD